MARSSNKLLVPGIEQYLDQVKYEIAQEFGVHLGSDTVSRANGSVGGEITKRLVQQAQAHLSGKQLYKDESQAWLDFFLFDNKSH